MSYTTLSTNTEGAMMTVRLNNGPVNTMSSAMCGEIFSVVAELAVNPEIKVVVFESANPDFFIAHFDLDDLLKGIAGDPSVPVSKFAGINIMQSLGLSIQSLPQVTVAKVDGACRGGGFELMLSMDMAFATERARFCFPEASIGFLPAGGGATFLPMKTGKARALEVMLTGRDFDGAEAEQYNFINRAFDDLKSLDRYVQDAATRIAGHSADSIQAIKATISKTFEGLTDGVMAGLAQENESMAACLSNPEVLATLQTMAQHAGTYETEIDLPETIRGM
jgi:enoyl-CoA hydratase/carnithine racemase